MKAKKETGKFISIEESRKNVGKKVNLRGWVYRIRESKGIIFLVLRDSSGIMQCVIKEGIPGFGDAQKTLNEASVELSGRVIKDDRAPEGFELKAEGFRVVGPAEDFPIKKDQSTELLLDHRHLWIRSRRLTQIFKIRSELFGAIDSFFRGRGFYEIQSPSITSSACEGGSTLFEVDYFGSKSYLTQSWQLYAEAMIASLEKIYCIAPSFRAEKSRTRRHLAEYWHAEAEMAWMDMDENLKLQEEFISFLVQEILKKRKKELEFLGRDLKILEKVKPPFERVTYDEALEILKKKGIKFQWGEDFGIDEEKVLTSQFDKPFFVVNYPRKAKAFYMKVNPENPKTVLCADMFAPEGYGEITGGSERETGLKELVKRIKAGGGNPRDYQWYLDTRRFGSVPHSGFGLGVERLLMWICKLDHIRDTIAFPRTINRVYP